MGRKVWSWGDLDGHDETSVQIVAPENGDVLSVRETDDVDVFATNGDHLRLTVAEARGLLAQLDHALRSFIGEPVEAPSSDPVVIERDR